MPDAAASAAPLDGVAAYRLIRSRIVGLLREADDAALNRAVPACPQWSVRETLSHLVGVCSDILAGRSDRTGSPERTAAQVASRQGQGVPDLLDEWAVTGEQVAAALTGRSALGQVVMDAVSHEYDLRVALGVPPPADDPVLDMALDWLTPWFGRHLDAGGVPSVRLVAGGRERVLGSGAPEVTLRTSRRDALRALTGRRSLAQVRALDWDGLHPDDLGPDGDLARWLAALIWGPFSPPPHDVEPTDRP